MLSDFIVARSDARQLKWLYFGRTGAFLPLSFLKFHFLSVIEGLVPVDLNLGMMDEKIVATVIRTDKTKTFVGVKPLYCSCTHMLLSSFCGEF